MWLLWNSTWTHKKRSRYKYIKCIIILKKDDGNTAVHMALAFGHYKIADMLMEAGGSTHILNKKG